MEKNITDNLKLVSDVNYYSFDYIENNMTETINLVCNSSDIKVDEFNLDILFAKNFLLCSF